MRKLYELAYAIADAKDALKLAEKYAYEISGHNPGQAADPEWGCPEIPADDGWPAMLQLHGKFAEIAAALESAVTPEIAEAIKAESDEDAEMER